MTSTRVLVVPAAGRGLRLGAAVPKALVLVNGRPMLHHLLDLYAPFIGSVVVVAAPDAHEAVTAAARAVRFDAHIVTQAAPTGMLDAITIGVDAAKPYQPERLWITWGDQVAVQRGTLERLAAIERDADLALPTVTRHEPYICFVRDADGRIVRVLQRREGDAMPEAGESDMGVFSLSPRASFEWLPEYAQTTDPGGSTGERNFLPFVAWAAQRGRVATCEPLDEREAIGINTPAELEQLAGWMRSR
jgi:bifunctional N-acetylglucosamine-1-phosphate-uridyltransferase/glucosamine-1-phosphate-acetyltransferase GlmU-like protein